MMIMTLCTFFELVIFYIYDQMIDMSLFILNFQSFLLHRALECIESNIFVESVSRVEKVELKINSETEEMGNTQERLQRYRFDTHSCYSDDFSSASSNVRINI